jgi:CheY-like chemotaxis protein
MDAKTVLVVDDEEDSRDICTTLLRHYGYHVLQATDGEYAVQLAREQRPDLILMDLMLPKLDGWSAGEWIKRDPQTADIPIIALTVHFSEADQARARASGFDSYLIKPCEPNRVLEEVQQLIGQATAEGP